MDTTCLSRERQRASEAGRHSARQGLYLEVQALGNPTYARDRERSRSSPSLATRSPTRLPIRASASRCRFICPDGAKCPAAGRAGPDDFSRASAHATLTFTTMSCGSRKSRQMVGPRRRERREQGEVAPIGQIDSQKTSWSPPRGSTSRPHRQTPKPDETRRVMKSRQFSAVALAVGFCFSCGGESADFTCTARNDEVAAAIQTTQDQLTELRTADWHSWKWLARVPWFGRYARIERLEVDLKNLQDEGFMLAIACGETLTRRSDLGVITVPRLNGGHAPNPRTQRRRGCEREARHRRGRFRFAQRGPSTHGWPDDPCQRVRRQDIGIPEPGRVSTRPGR